MDITETLAPDSQQLDAVDLLGGPRTFTIERVNKGNAEQPVNVHFTDFPRPWRPSKGMRRVLASCWGADASQWIGRRVRLYCDPDVTFGKDRVGGTRIAALSHIEGPKSIPLLVSRGKSQMYSVDPLVEEARRTTSPTAEDVAACTSTDELRRMWQASGEDVRALITARVTELSQPTAEPEPDPETGEVPMGPAFDNRNPDVDPWAEQQA